MIALYIALGLAGLFVALNLVALALPRTWSVERRATIAADRAVVHSLVADFRHGWSRWNPWGPAADPSIRMTYSGPDGGAGATQTWKGGETGGGRMTITLATAERVGYDLAFGPFTIAGGLDLSPAAAGTDVHWQVSGRIAGLPAFRFGRFFAQRVVGRALERGLATLATEAAADYGLQTSSHQPGPSLADAAVSRQSLAASIASDSTGAALSSKVSQ